MANLSPEQAAFQQKKAALTDRLFAPLSLKAIR